MMTSNDCPERKRDEKYVMCNLENQNDLSLEPRPEFQLSVLSDQIEPADTKGHPNRWRTSRRSCEERKTPTQVTLPPSGLAMAWLSTGKALTLTPTSSNPHRD
ncbi:hypothetical protein RRG08_059767 [Elysia crispata]|uniref:Uncharacterized protein n=1 Tax=Elysia crispata TaxID=231223 RepID=A0AAE1BEY6_9GAST|nr:hypothetical protein RRG08_059767 [Elysia crispata]